jgi:hypothetical protein
MSVANIGKKGACEAFSFDTIAWEMLHHLFFFKEKIEMGRVYVFL